MCSENPWWDGKGRHNPWLVGEFEDGKQTGYYEAKGVITSGRIRYSTVS